MRRKFDRFQPTRNSIQQLTRTRNKCQHAIQTDAKHFGPNSAACYWLTLFYVRLHLSLKGLPNLKLYRATISEYCPQTCNGFFEFLLLKCFANYTFHSFKTVSRSCSTSLFVLNIICRPGLGCSKVG